ncbi:FAD-dependent oxidoreductase [Jeotgalibacillus sp. JSM ZJ347]|uniref:FAD-dependent oxidoreductase n=1 Tax=Jeotgalibacillus sp. JSM ZJ347 TaxID=3342117 RepID=UPI0035A92C6F
MGESFIDQYIINQSYWLEDGVPDAEKLTDNHETDILIAGAGIAGITAGLLLAKEGFKVTIADANRICQGTTGYTTAKVTAQHGMVYDQFLSQHGKEKAKLYYDANAEAMNWMKQQISEHEIDCDFSIQEAGVYTIDQPEQLEREWKAYQALGIDGEFTDEMPYDIGAAAVLKMSNQFQFHPVKYLKAILSEFLKLGGKVYEKTKLLEADEHSDGVEAKTEDGYTIKAKKLIAATHFPFVDFKGLYFSRLKPERSYTSAAVVNESFAEGMYISAENPTKSIRTTPYKNGKKLLIIGGEGHKTGQNDIEGSRYQRLESFAKAKFGVTDFKYRWSSQDLYTVSGIPYAGLVTGHHDHIYIATGFRKWGMSGGTAAAHIIKDLITHKHNRFQELFNPSSHDVSSSIGTFVSENANVGAELVKGKLKSPDKTEENILRGEGGIIKDNSGKTGAYRDEEGKLHKVDITCTHMGCECAWNQDERSWDCPCHGSRFSFDGAVLEGPAVTPLKKK